MRQKISLYSIIGGILLLLVNNGWIKIDVDPKPPVVDNTPVVVDPVVVDPVVNPPVVTPPVVVPPVVEPDVIVPTPVVDNAVVNKYPEVPANLVDISKPIYELLVKCKNRNDALVLAETYRVWSNMDTNLADKIGKTSMLVTFNKEILKGMMKENGLAIDFCPGMADAINNVMVAQLGDDPRNFVVVDASLKGDEKKKEEERQSKIADTQIKDIFRAISSQAYKAYTNHKGANAAS